MHSHQLSPRMRAFVLRMERRSELVMLHQDHKDNEARKNDNMGSTGSKGGEKREHHL